VLDVEEVLISAFSGKHRVKPSADSGEHCVVRALRREGGPSEHSVEFLKKPSNSKLY
jgi:hypothetical protein